MEAAVVALLVVFPLLGALSRRWAAVAAALLGWPLFYAGLNQGWWGYGTGDGWQAIAAVLTLIGVGTTAVAVVVARAVR